MSKMRIKHGSPLSMDWQLRRILKQKIFPPFSLLYQHNSLSKPTYRLHQADSQIYRNS